VKIVECLSNNSKREILNYLLAKIKTIVLYCKGMRIDKFLKVSRILKRRSLAAEACGSEKVFVNGRAAKPGLRLKIGDEVRIAFAAKSLCFTVKALNEKASKEEAASLYEIKSEN